MPASFLRHAATVLPLCLGLACPALPAQAPALPAATPLKVPELSYQKITLSNGLVVLLHEDHRLPLVALDVWYHVGPLNERAGRTGFAHLFEHMMFEGSEHVGEKAHFKYVEGAGGTDINGTTDFDRTNYFETLPSNQLELGLWLESDRMGFLLEKLDRTRLANQRDVVRNERRQGENRPYSLADEEVFHLLFPKDHPYYASVIGSHADIEAARLADVRDFSRRFYTPNNASLAIAGDFNPATLKPLLEKYFGPIPAGPPVEPVNIKTPAITTERHATVTDTVQLPRLSVAWLTPPAFTPGEANADLFAHILGGGKASRLYRKLVVEQQLAQSVECGNSGLKLASVFGCDITAKPNVKLEQLEAVLNSEIATLQQTGPTAAELEEARTTDLTGKISGLQRLGGFGGVADTLDRYNQFTGDPGYLPKDIARYQAVTTSSLQQFAKASLNQNQRVVVETVIGKKVLNDVPRSPDDTDAKTPVTPPYPATFEQAQTWRDKAPAAGPVPAFLLPIPHTFKLSNGLAVYLIEDHALPVLSAQVVSQAGNTSNPSNQPGLSSLTARVMAESTTTRNAAELAEAAESIGSTVRSSSTPDGGSIALSALSNHGAALLTLLADVVEHPSFTPADFERLRKERVVSIGTEADRPVTIAFRVGQRALYGDTPYGFPSSGTIASVNALKDTDLRQFWQSHYLPANSALLLAGDLTAAQARQLAESNFGAWSGAGSPPSIPAAPATPTTRRVILVDKPGAPQTAVFAFGSGLPRNDPEQPAAAVMDDILGGLFSSRINMNLRERHGYTYGGFAFFQYGQKSGVFTTGAQVRTDVTAPATKELFYELDHMRSDPATPEELTLARSSELRSLPGQFETTDSVVSGLSELFLYSLPADYFHTLPARLEAVNAAAVQQAANKYIHPEHMIVVEVGDRSKIEPGLKELNLGPIEVRDAMGEPIH